MNIPQCVHNNIGPIDSKNDHDDSVENASDNQRSVSGSDADCSGSEDDNTVLNTVVNGEQIAHFHNSDNSQEEHSGRQLHATVNHSEPDPPFSPVQR